MFHKNFSKVPSLSCTGSHSMINDNIIKILDASADQMRHFMGMFIEQKFFRKTRSSVLVKFFLFIHILKRRKIFGFNACSDNKIKTLDVCKNQIRHFREILTEQKFFRKPRSIIWDNPFISIPILKMSEILGFGICSDKKSKTFSACTDQMRHLREMFTEQKFFREQRSIVKVKSFISILILKVSEIFGFRWNFKPSKKSSSQPRINGAFFFLSV